MRIRAIKQLCGAYGSASIGEMIDVPEAVAVAWIRDGAAEHFGTAISVEMATAEPKAEIPEHKTRRSK